MTQSVRLPDFFNQRPNRSSLLPYAGAHQLKKGIFIKKALASGHVDKISTESPVKKSIEFILREPGVSSIIIGTLNIQHLEEVVRYALESMTLR